MALQISISNAIGARAVAGGGGIDPDAQAFITASGITDATQQSAINQLVVDLKGYNIWSKMKAIYPMVGGTSTSTSYNLRNTAQYQISWSGGVTWGANGVQFGGVNGYGNTGLKPSTIGMGQNSQHLSFYSRTNSNGTEIEIGAQDATGAIGSLIEIRTSGTTYYRVNSVGSYITYADANSLGFYTTNRTALNVVNGWKNGTKVATGATVSSGNLNNDIWIGAWNNLNGAAKYYSTKQCAFASIGDGLTDTEAANFYTAVQTFQTTLGRSIGTQTVSDADAQAFVTNAGIVDQVEANAVNNLVIGLKADSLWTKMKAVYPFVGGTATTNKFNLVNPLDTDAAFRLVFNGGWTHSATGATPNGTNGWADTKLISQSVLGLNSTHVSVYSRTNVNNLAPSIGNVTGGVNGEVSLWPNYANVLYLRVNNPTVSSIANFDSRGLFIGNRNSSTQINISIRGTQTTFNQNSNSLYPQPFQLGAVNPNNFDTRQLAFASIGDGLTSQNMTDLTTRVTTFQTALNRNV